MAQSYLKFYFTCCYLILSAGADFLLYLAHYGSFNGERGLIIWKQA